VATARVRGIYTTALTKLLLEQDFTIVQASTTTKQRFSLLDNEASPDLDIYDRRDRQGVHALGNAESISNFISLLQCRLEDVIIRKWAVTVNGIHKGLVSAKDSATHTALVNIGPAVGVITQGEISNIEKEQVVVQVERYRLGSKVPTLTTDIKIPGKHAVLIPQRLVKISRNIQDSNTRLRLHQLGEELAPPNWGILWRTSAAGQSPESLRNEIVTLTKIAEEVMEKAEHVEAPAVLWEGATFVDVEFPAPSKRELDDVRKSVAPTIDGHHYYKACGGRVSTALEMAERLLEKGGFHADIDEVFRQTVEQEYPDNGSWIKIEHVKLDGKVLHLGPALIEVFDPSESFIRFHRVFRREGVYDGLETRKEPDDYAVTEAKLGEWHFKTQYFSKDGKLKGTYINLNTPIELYPYGIRYVDLEVDVCVWPDGRIETLDEEKLNEALRRGIVTHKIIEIAKEKLQKIIHDVSAH